MGSQSSKSNDHKKNLNNENNGDSSMLMRDNISSYQGVRTETTESGKKSISNGSTTSDRVDTPQEVAPQEVKIPTLFEWKEGGNIVYVTGSFCGWSQFFIMSKNNDGVFQLTLDLPKGYHQYKFKVDNQWRYSTMFPVINDNGNTNNFVDTTNWQAPALKKDEKKDIKAKPKVNGKVKRDDYSQFYPQKTELNTDAPPIPQHYANSFNIDYNTRQHLIGNSKYLNRTEQNLLSENNSFKQIAKPPHVNLNHLHSKNITGLKFNSVLALCTSRLRNKFTTVIYYRPNHSLR